MNKRMRLQIFYGGGSVIDREITYHGETLEEIAEAVDRDNNELLEYMLTRDDKGAKAFCFGGFMFSKEIIIAAQMTEPEF